jgi:hypothetical protein
VGADVVPPPLITRANLEAIGGAGIGKQTKPPSAPIGLPSSTVRIPDTALRFHPLANRAFLASQLLGRKFL